MGKAVRICVVAIIIVTCLPGGPAHAQSGTDVSPAIPVHPDVPTILRLPDAIERAWIHYGDDFRVKGVGSEVYVRPRPGTPAGAEALLEVKTATMHRIFLLRVVARPEDARRELTVPAAPAAAHVDHAARTAVEPTPAATTPAPPAASASNPAPGPAAADPQAMQPASTAGDARTPMTDLPPGFDLSLHAFVGIGFAGLDLAGYEPQAGFQSLQALGVRLAGARPGARWALEASVSGERPAGSMKFRTGDGSQLEVSGSWLRAEVGMRAQLARGGWTPSVILGVGAQTHLRQTEQRNPSGRLVSSVSAMEHGAVAALGLRLQYRASKVLLGLEFQVRRGVPDDYHAEVALGTIGFFPDQENEP